MNKTNKTYKTNRNAKMDSADRQLNIEQGPTKPKNGNLNLIPNQRQG